MAAETEHSGPPDARCLALPYGFTQADIDQIARRAVRTARAAGGDPEDRYDAAWHAIAETILTNPEQLDHAELTEAAWKAVNQVGSDTRRHHGRDERGRTRRGFARYWEGSGWRPTAPEDVLDHVALNSIWPRLTPTDRRALAARAEHPTAKAAAAALGIRYHTYAMQLSRARRRFRALWQGDTQERSPMPEPAPSLPAKCDPPEPTPPTPAKYDPLNRLLVERMVRLRRARGWSAERLASALTQAGRPTRRSTLANVESLHSRIPADLLVALAEVLGVPVGALAALECVMCHGTPPKGFACTTCGVISDTRTTDPA